MTELSILTPWQLGPAGGASARYMKGPRSWIELSGGLGGRLGSSLERRKGLVETQACRTTPNLAAI